MHLPETEEGFKISESVNLINNLLPARVNNGNARIINESREDRSQGGTIASNSMWVRGASGLR
jgi:hypothetical protein